MKSTSQSKSTNNCFTPGQVQELYNIVEQEKRIRPLLHDTEIALNEAIEVSKAKTEQINSLKSSHTNLENQVANLETQREKDKELFDIKLERKDVQHKIEITILKSEKKQSFWKGLKTGSVVTAAAVLVGFIIIK